MNVAIICAGIGGSACAYYLSQWNPAIEITIFEKEPYCGGRIKTISINEKPFTTCRIDIGAGFFQEHNLLINHLVDELNLQKEPVTASTFAILGKTEYVFKASEKNIVNAFKLIKKYRMNVRRFLKLGSFAGTLINRMYEIIETPFQSIEELLEKTELREYARVSCTDLFKTQGISEKFAMEFIEPLVNHLTYQGLRANGLIGLAFAFTLANPTIYSITGGNVQLVKALLNSSNATTRYGCEIQKIEKKNGKYEVRGLEDGKHTIKEKFDVIIIATPIDSSNIQLSGFNQNAVNVMQNNQKELIGVSVTITLVKGRINPYFFGMTSPEQMPGSISTTLECTLPLIAIEKRLTKDDQDLYYITSRQPPSKNFLDQIFLKQYEVVKMHHWKHAVGDMTPREVHDPIVLDDNCYYLSSIDKLLTAMEFSVIMGRNIAMLVSNSNP